MRRIEVTDSRAALGLYRVDSHVGSVCIDIDSIPKHCRVSIFENGRSFSKYVRDYQMKDVWAAMKSYAPNADRIA